MTDYKQLYHEALQRAEQAESNWDKALQYAQKEVDEERALAYTISAGEYILKYMKKLEDNQ